MTLNYPTASDYISAVQNPRTAFSLPILQASTFAADPVLGVPMPASGNAAVVFRAQVAGRDRALRFYTREEDPATRSRYSGLNRRLADPRVGPCVAKATWIDDAVTINQRRWPMVDMEWVDGRTLDDYVNFLASGDNSAALGALAANWRVLINTLQSAQFAHGDLQHGNVLVDSTSSLRLVDFDGSWIEEFSGMTPPAETGNPNYQRPDREWGRWMDTFPGLVVYTALLGLSNNPGQWPEHATKDRILFSKEDFDAFDTPTWRLLDGIHDTQVAQAVRLLKHCCKGRWNATASLESLLTESVVIPPPRTEAPADAPWWVQTGAVQPGPTVRLPPPPEAAVPTPSASQRPSEQTRPGKPDYDWHRQIPTSAPTRTGPASPPVTSSLPVQAASSARREWGQAIRLALLLGVALGLTTFAVWWGITHTVADSGRAGITVGVVFAILMIPVLRGRR